MWNVIKTEVVFLKVTCANVTQDLGVCVNWYWDILGQCTYVRSSISCSSSSHSLYSSCSRLIGKKTFVIVQVDAAACLT